MTNVGTLLQVNLFIISKTLTNTLILNGASINADHSCYRWSPDGTKILFYKSIYSGNTTDGWALNIMNANGSNLHSITPITGTVGYYFSAWSPDGSKIVSNYFKSNPDNANYLLVMNNNGTNSKQIYYNASENISYVDWGFIHNTNNCLLTITNQPASTTTCNSGSANFSVTATGDTAISYQWQVNIGSWSNITTAGSNPAYSGYTSSTLSITNPQVNGLKYRCLVSDCLPVTIDTSKTATLTVKPGCNEIKACFTSMTVSNPSGGRWICGQSITIGDTISAVLEGNLNDYDVPWCESFTCCNSNSYNGMSISRHTIKADTSYVILMTGGLSGGSYWAYGFIEIPSCWSIDSITNNSDGRGNIYYTIVNNKISLQVGTSQTNCVCSDCGRVNLNIYVHLIHAGPNQVICQGNSASLKVTGNASYKWSTGDTTASITVKPANTTMYLVTTTCACCKIIDSVKVTVNPSPSVEAGTSQNICLGSSATLTATGAATYKWSTGATTASVIVSPGNTTTYTVTGTTNGCSNTASVIVTVNSFPTATITPTSSTTFCAGESVTLSSTTSTGYTYQWKNNGIKIPGATNNTYTVDSSGNYTVVISNSYGCARSFGTGLPTGGTITDIGGNRIHTFNSPGVLYFPSGFSTNVQVLVVAGGGGGGGNGGGGGGAGGLIFNFSYPVSEGSYPVTVGAGSSFTYNTSPIAGGNSVFGSITAYGGGGGASRDAGGDALSGGSGGGGGGSQNGYTPAAAGITGQGNSGGTGYNNGCQSAGGGGGGAGSKATAAAYNTGGNGGSGLSYPISGIATYYAGGGGGGVTCIGGTGGLAGNGGGGAGSSGSGVGISGTSNTGGGGGGGGAGANGGAGGSGIVIVAYPDTINLAITVNVNPIPALTISPAKASICEGDSVILTANIGSVQGCSISDLPANLQQGLVAYYPFCGNANDESGKENNGTVNGQL